MKRVTIKVAADTAPQAVANSLYKGVLAQVEEDDSINIVVRAVGAGAVNQAIKGIAIAERTTGVADTRHRRRPRLCQHA